jgi:RecA-family ATPase
MPAGSKLIILDTLADIYIGNENDRALVNEFIKVHLGSLVKQYEATILILAHPSLSGRSRGDHSSGSTAWENAVRNRLVFFPNKKFDEVMTLKCVKSNYAKSGNEINVEYSKGRFILSDIDNKKEQEEEAEIRDFMQVLSASMVDQDEVSLATLAGDMKEHRDAKLLCVKYKAGIIKKINDILKKPRIFCGLVYEIKTEIQGRNRKIHKIVRKVLDDTIEWY